MASNAALSTRLLIHILKRGGEKREEGGMEEGKGRERERKRERERERERGLEYVAS